MWLALGLLAGCRADREVVWDAVGGSDVPADVAVALVTFGRVEGDRDVVDAVHAAGTTLTMDVRNRDGGAVNGWSVESLAPDICQVIAVPDTAQDALRVELLFRAQGATDLFVIDEQGEVQDFQPIEIRDPAEADLTAYELVATGVSESLEAVHMLPGGFATLAVAWRSDDGTGLRGVGVLGVQTDLPDADAVGTDALAAQGLEAFDLAIAPRAEPAAGELELTASGAEIRRYPLEIHAESAVDRLELDLVTAPGPEPHGTVRALLLAADAEILGTPVAWSEDGMAVGDATWVGWEGDGDATSELTACWKDLCEAVTIPGNITSTGLAQVDAPGGCGCDSAHGGASALGWIIAIGLVRRRRAGGA